MTNTKTLPRFANQYTNHPLADLPLKCNVNNNKVVQEYKEDTDINCIIEKYSNGQIDKLPVARTYNFGDETNIIKSFDDAKKFVASVESDFNSLPANIKREFGNNPQQYLTEFSKVFTDKEYGEKFAKLGIFNYKNAECNPACPDTSLLTRAGDSTNDKKSSDVTNSVNSNNVGDVQNGSN